MPVGKDKTKSPKTLKPKEWENGELFYNGNPFGQIYCYFSQFWRLEVQNKCAIKVDFSSFL